MSSPGYHSRRIGLKCYMLQLFISTATHIRLLANRPLTIFFTANAIESNFRWLWNHILASASHNLLLYRLIEFYVCFWCFFLLLEKHNHREKRSLRRANLEFWKVRWRLRLDFFSDGRKISFQVKTIRSSTSTRTWPRTLTEAFPVNFWFIFDSWWPPFLGFA